MKRRIWMTKKKLRGGWGYALARFPDGSIRIVEDFYGLGFGMTGVGKYDTKGSDDGPRDKDCVPVKLRPGEKNMIIDDLYIAICEEKGYKIDKKVTAKFKKKK